MNFCRIFISFLLNYSANLRQRKLWQSSRFSEYFHMCLWTRLSQLIPFMNVNYSYAYLSYNLIFKNRLIISVICLIYKQLRWLKFCREIYMYSVYIITGTQENNVWRGGGGLRKIGPQAHVQIFTRRRQSFIKNLRHSEWWAFSKWI